jgi:hypothetical protein
MSSPAASPSPASPPTSAAREEEPPRDAAAVRKALGLRWWREVLYILAFYFVYSVVRNMQGSASVGEQHAFQNALEIIDIERFLHIYNERAVQRAFLDYRGFIEFWNLFYGTFHFFVTIGALLLLFRRFPERYPKWRNVLACTTGVALVGFATYPLMPPRLLDQIDPSFGFVDTLRVYGSLWSFDSGAMHKISNQYAAMPSLHFGWSSWCALVLIPALPRTWMKVIAVLYPFATTFSIVVTANHYWLDAVGGAVALAIGYGLGVIVTNWLAGRRRVLRPVVQNRE